jgi:hypothetical protein
MDPNSLVNGLGSYFAGSEEERRRREEANRLRYEREMANIRNFYQGVANNVPVQPLSIPNSNAPRQPGMPTVQSSVDLNDLGESTGWFDRSLRFLSNVLSPVQLAQDMSFAFAAGRLDPDKSVSDYFSEIEWATYVPLGAIPNRPVSGEDLLRLNGVENENSAFWGGLVMDLVADPLLAGSLLRGVSKASDVLGAVSVARGLRKAADVADTATEATMLVGATPTARVVGAARTLPGFRQFEQAVTDNTVSKYVTAGLQSMLQRTVTAPEGLGGRSYSLGGLFVQDAGRLPGGPEIIRQASGVSEEVAENTMIQLIRADAMAGGTRWKDWLKSFNRSMTVMYDVPVNTVNSFNPATSRAIMTSSYAQADQLGLTLDPLSRGITSDAFLPAASGQSPRMQQAVRDIDEILDTQRTTQMTFPIRSGPFRGTTKDVPAVAEEAAILNQFESEVARMRQVAKANGDDPDAVENAYRGVVSTFQKLSATEGYFASGYAPMMQMFTETLGGRLASLMSSNAKFSAAINKAGGIAAVTRESWRELIRSGRRNEAQATLNSTVRLARNKSLPGITALAPEERAMLRYNDMFQNYSQISGLDLPDYFNNLTRGHMRRAFGVFMDEGSWANYVSDLKSGPAGNRLVTHNIISDQAIDAQMRQAGLTREADLAQEYIRQIAPPSPVGSSGPTGPRPMGGFVRMSDLSEFMMSRGLTSGQVERFQRAFVGAAQPELLRVADQLVQYGRTNIGQNINMNVRGGTGSDVLTAARQNLGKDEVETLMELMDPIVSRAQTAQASGAATRRIESITGILSEAEKRGLIVDSASSAKSLVPNWWVSVPANQAGFLQGLGGKTVHPMVYREVKNVMMAGRRSHRQAGGLQTLRSMITAGYLASPATSAANIAGGFWTAAMYGINPAKLMQNMVDVYRDWRKMGRDLPELQHMRGIVDNGQAHSEIINMGGDLGEISNLNLGVRGFSKAIGDGVRRYHEALRRPLGTGALGLGFFELSEALFKMGTFRMVMNQTGDVDEARKMARFVVFDYANQPGAVQLARDTGLFLFPGFEYFMLGRTANAALTRPALMATMERVPGAITQAVLQDEDDRNALIAGMPDWMLEGKYIPIRRKENGDVTTIPWSQIFPTSSMTGAPFIESLKTAGLWGPVIDTVSALGSISGMGSAQDPGEARLTGTMGRRVLQSGVTSWEDPQEVVGNVMSYLYNSFAPAILRKTYSPAEDADRSARGLVPTLMNSVIDVPEDMASTGRSVREMYSRRVDQDLFDSIVSFGLRTTRNVATLGPLADAQTVVGRAFNNLNRDVRELERQMILARAEGNPALENSLSKRRDRMILRFRERWGDRMTELRRMSNEGRFDSPSSMR